ncbi:MAG: PilZ domain-containing protein [Candidatus Omnitrophica bacterium]|nr:PilZ domain-containing protein [Candidatus Omnitrophota bacterium]
MAYQMGSNEQRSQPRFSVDFPVTIKVGTQLTVKGQIKDLSGSSAFIKIKNNIYLNVNDEVGIVIQTALDEDAVLEGTAHISRIVPGEGFAVYFTKINEASTKWLKKFIQQAG